jgi:2-polyprenyl-3-methyl-5-hydroxy-6-metoxy-1,4-benzoquinol methylase
LATCPACDTAGAPLSFHSVRGSVHRCPPCGVFFVSDPLTRDDQATLFYSTIDERRYVSYFEPFRKGQYRQVLGGLSLAKGSSHLDVGASYGWMVEVGLELGLDSVGIEPGDAPVPEAEVRRRVERRSLEEYAATAARRFDLITIWHVLEHLPRPLEAVRLLRGLLAEEGRLLVAVPNAEGWMYHLALIFQRALRSPRLMEELWYFHNPNMHFLYYTAGALEGLLRRAGLAPERHSTMEAFDWTTIHQRVERRLPRQGLRFLGPLIAFSGFTRRENLIAIARR